MYIFCTVHPHLPIKPSENSSCAHKGARAEDSCTYCPRPGNNCAPSTDRSFYICSIYRPSNCRYERVAQGLQSTGPAQGNRLLQTPPPCRLITPPPHPVPIEHHAPLPAPDTHGDCNPPVPRITQQCVYSKASTRQMHSKPIAVSGSGHVIKQVNSFGTAIHMQGNPPPQKRFLVGCSFVSPFTPPSPNTHDACFALGASKAFLVGENTMCSPSRHCRDARVYGHTTTDMHDIEYTPPPASLQ